MRSPHPRRVAALAVASLTLGLLPGAAAAATAPVSAPTGGVAARAVAKEAAPPVVLPANPRGLKAPVKMGPDVDPPAGYQGQQACLVRAMPGIVRLRALVLATYGRGGDSSAAPRACSVGDRSEHKEGRAWDWMVSVSNKADKSAAADFLSWLTGPGPSGVRGEMAFRLGVMYVIYNHRSWSSYTGEWKEYTGSDPHTSHVHVSLSWNGARAHTSFWTGHVWP